MRVEAGSGLWVVPPSHALWMPAGVEHAIRMSGQVEMRTVYIDPAHMPATPEDCRVLFVSPLLRELILRAMHVPRMKAFELFDLGRSVTYVALELGYSSPSAFSKMFRRWMGTAPAAMLADERDQ